MVVYAEEVKAKVAIFKRIKVKTEVVDILKQKVEAKAEGDEF